MKSYTITLNEQSIKALEELKPKFLHNPEHWTMEEWIVFTLQQGYAKLKEESK